MSDIKEGIAQILAENDGYGDYEVVAKYYLPQVDSIISYLKSQNVVRLKDNQELPEMLESKYGLEPYSLNPYSYDASQKDMLKAKFKAVEELE